MIAAAIRCLCRRSAVLGLAVLLTMVACTFAQAADPLAEQKARAEQVQALIEQLGSDSYFVRDRAEQQLAAMGFDAFDALTKAELHPDLEIASRARYLVRLMQVEWTQEGDPAAVQQLLSGYDQLEDTERIERIHKLGQLPQGQGLAALCRLARFQKSESLSKLAALAATGQQADDMDLEELPTGIPVDEVARDVVEQAREQHRAALQGGLRPVTDEQRRIIISTVGSSDRPAAQWLLAFAELSQDPTAALDATGKLIEREVSTLDQFPQRTSRLILLEMLSQQVHWLIVSDREEPAHTTMLRMLEFEPGDEESMPQLLRWMIERQAWPVIEEMSQRFATQVEKNPRLLYNFAYARLRADQPEESQRLAAQALEVGGNTVEERYATAIYLQQRGWIRWAMDEYRQLIKISPEPSSPYVLRSQMLLAELLYDQGDYLAAAEVLRESAEVLDRVAKDGQVTASRDPAGTRARMNYFLALDAMAAENWESAKELLDKAFGHASLDADILIAMYRLPNIDPPRREQVIRSINQAVENYETEILKDPENATPYNQIAWLVANTQGNKKRALQLSEKSLQLMPHTPGYMDTLGRCHYALEDYASAVQVQRDAVLMEPYSGQMSRQLALFQEALATQQAAANNNADMDPSETDE